MSSDKHISLETKRFIDTDSCRFYDSPTCSDVKIVVLNMFGMETVVIHAHRIILAAGSGYFNREHELAKKAVRYYTHQSCLLHSLTLSPIGSEG